MMQSSPTIPLLEDRASSSVPRVKVCGFLDRENLRAVAALGVDAVGINFWPRSKRYLAPASFAGWVGDLPSQVLRIGVFVNPEDEEVLGPFRAGLIHVAQMHGDETPAQCERLRGHGVPVIKAVGFCGSEDFERAAACSSYVLLDAWAPQARGGTGETIDWAGVRTAMDARPGVKVVLSGGLRPENAAEAVALVRPAMIDVASGVEDSPGIKNLGAVERFLAEVRG